MELLTYVDESGTEADPAYCVIAGYIASPEIWRSFDDTWRAILGPIPEFHSTQFFSRKNAKGSQTNPYVDWDDGKAFEFLRKLVDAIRDHGMLPVRGAVDVADFKSFGFTQRQVLTQARVTPAGRVAGSGSPNKPYHLAFIYTLDQATAIAGPDDLVHFIFDETDEAPLALQNFTRYRENRDHPKWKKLGRLAFASSAKEPGLQAADLHAHLWNRQLSYPGSMQDDRTFAKVLLDGVESEIGIWKREDMMRLLGTLSHTQLEGLSERYDKD